MSNRTVYSTSTVGARRKRSTCTGMAKVWKAPVRHHYVLEVVNHHRETPEAPQYLGPFIGLEATDAAIDAAWAEGLEVTDSTCAATCPACKLPVL